ncbi:MAG: hypothetical protein JSR18_04325 [Proteobacteria bacterium]|nr:hypothetical protein [Pseudomonadota bacterium]
MLVALPALVGFAAEATFRDTRRASLAAVLGAAVVTCGAVQILEPAAAWNWLAALMVSPLPIAISIAVAMFWYDRFGKPRRRSRDA